jgi:parallel beta-helix repeat protein
MGTINASNTTDVTIQAATACASGMDPVIVPATPITGGWTVYSGNIYVTHVGFQVAQVFANSQLLNLAHYPDSNQESGWLVPNPNPSTTPAYSSTASYPVIFPALPSTDLIGAQITYRGNYPWDIGTRRIGAYNTSNSTATLDPVTDVDLIGEDAQAVKRFYLEGKPWMLTKTTSPGWAFVGGSSGGSLYVRMPDGQAPGSRIMAAYPVRHVIDARGAVRFTLNHVRVAGGDIGVDGGYLDSTGTASDHMKILYSEVGYSNWSAIYASNSKYLTVDHSSVYGALHSGIYARTGSTSSVVTHNDFFHVNDIGMHKGGVAAIYINKDTGPLIQYNNVYYSGKTGIWAGQSTYAVVNYNSVDYACLHHGDCGGIYLFSPTATHPANNAHVFSNFVGHVTGEIVRIGGTSPERYAIYLDDYANNVIVRGNTIQNNDAGMQIHLGSSNSIEGNTFNGNSRFDILFTDSGYKSGDLMKNNFIHANNQFQGSNEAFYFAFGGLSKAPVQGVSTPAAVFSSTDRNSYGTYKLISNVPGLIYY